MVLRIDTPSLARLPWETMYDHTARTYVCRRNQLVRHILAPSAVAPLRVPPPLKILGVVSSPSGLPALNVKKAQDQLGDALAVPGTVVTRVGFLGRTACERALTRGVAADTLTSVRIRHTPLRASPWPGRLLRWLSARIARATGRDPCPDVPNTLSKSVAMRSRQVKPVHGTGRRTRWHAADAAGHRRMRPRATRSLRGYKVVGAAPTTWESSGRRLDLEGLRAC